MKPDYRPKYTNVETIKISVQSYLDRELIKTAAARG